MSDIKLTIKQRKFRWLGHTLRKGHGDITNQALTWNPQGKRKPGRPKPTLRRDLLSELQDEEISSISNASTFSKSKEYWRTILMLYKGDITCYDNLKIVFTNWRLFFL